MQNLKKLLGPLVQENRPSDYIETHLPLKSIFVAAQPRKIFTNIKGLADNIVHEELLYPVLVNGYQSGADAKVRKHLAHVNFIYRSKSRLKDVPIYKGFRIILIAGERRLRAFKLLWNVGCSKCLARYGPESPGTCYRRRFGNRGIWARVYQRSPEKTVSMQTSENQHESLLPHEDAIQIGYRFRAKLRFEDPRYPKARFAREMGKDPETVYDAIDYFTQPEKTFNFVAIGILPYSIGRLLGKFYARVGGTPKGRDAYDSLLLNVLGASYKAQDFKKIVRERISFLVNPTPTLGKIFNLSANRDAEARYIRRVVGQNMIFALSHYERYFQKANMLFMDGALGISQEQTRALIDESIKKGETKYIYSDLAVLRHLGRLVEELKVTNGHLERLSLAPRKLPHYKEVIGNTERLTNILISHMEEAGEC